MWGAADAKLLLPPLAGGSELSFAIRPAPGPEPVTLLIDGEEILTVGGDTAEERDRYVMRSETPERASLLEIQRRRGYSPGPHDQRRLAVQLFELRASDASSPWACDLGRPWDRESVNVELHGVHAPEQFPGFGHGVWTGPRARLGLPAARGTLRIRLWAPRPTPPRTVIWIGNRQASGQLEITHLPAEFEFEVRTEDVVGGRVDVEIVSDPYRPSERGGDDDRSLGVVVSKVVFEPFEPAS